MERLAKTLSALDNTFGVSGEEDAVAGASAAVAS